MSPFDYLLEKIAAASFLDEPFKHLEIRDFLSPEHFQAITSSPRIGFGRVKSTEELLERLSASGYKTISFPGCVTSEAEYLDWFYKKSSKSYHENTEGFGMVFRLMDYGDPLLKALDEFFLSPDLKEVVARKFGIEGQTRTDCGIQKYLHGYEISPHADIRRKAATWMLNINPGEGAEEADYHTHYMKLKPGWRFVGEFWKENGDLDRDWLPWQWCETVKRQPKNNSIVFFSPADDTLHAVRADYDHTATQRTQFYGNLWYDREDIPKVDYKHFDIRRQMADKAKTLSVPQAAPTCLSQPAVDGLIARTLKAAKKAMT